MWPNWCAPEVLRGEVPSEASDVFSFGTTMLVVITQRSPIEVLAMLGNSSSSLGFVQWVDQHRDELTKDCPPILIALMRLAFECCEEDPEKRPNMTEVVRRLKAIKVVHIHRKLRN